jgi:hypothetical protein
MLSFVVCIKKLLLQESFAGVCPRLAGEPEAKQPPAGEAFSAEQGNKNASPQAVFTVIFHLSTLACLLSQSVKKVGVILVVMQL